MKTFKIKNLEPETYFSISGAKFSNTYQLIGECEPGLYAAELNNDIFEFDSNTKVVKIDGFQLYLLQGGKNWD